MHLRSARPTLKGHIMFLGLRTVIYPAPDLAASRAWFSQLLGIEPYFDETFYVGFNVAGYELALDPSGDPGLGPITYWGVADADAALAQLLAAGATARGEVQDVGDGIRVATPGAGRHGARGHREPARHTDHVDGLQHRDRAMTGPRQQIQTAQRPVRPISRATAASFLVLVDDVGAQPYGYVAPLGDVPPVEHESAPGVSPARQAVHALRRRAGSARSGRSRRGSRSAVPRRTG